MSSAMGSTGLNLPAPGLAETPPAGASAVTAVPAAAPAIAAAHFRALLAFETDCADVHAAFAAGTVDFVLIDVRGPNAFARGAVPGAINIPHRELSALRLASIPRETVLVVYCAGPHCNGADRAGLRLAELGRPVKKMLGGITGWLDEGFALTAA